MKLKFKLDNLDGLDDALKGFYSQGQDGKYYLDVDGAVAKERLDEFRQTNVELMKKYDSVKDLDVEKYKAWEEEHRKKAEGELINAGKVDELIEQRVQAMRTDYEAKIKTYEDRISQDSRRLEVLLIDNEVRAAAVQSGVSPAAVDDVLLRAKTVYQVKDGVPLAVDSKGQTLYGKDGQTPLAISDWVKGLKDSASHLFMQSNGSGSGNNGNSGRKPTGNMSAAEKVRMGLEAGESKYVS